MIVQYDLPISAKRSQLLDRMTLDDQILNVDLVSSDLLRTLDFKFNETLIPNKFKQRTDKDAVSIVSTLLAAGYKLKNNVYEEAINMDKMSRSRFQFIGNTIERIKNMNERYGVTNKMRYIMDTTKYMANGIYHRLIPERLQMHMPTKDQMVDLISTVITLSFESAIDKPDLFKIDPNSILQKIDSTKSFLFPPKFKKYH